MYLRLQLAVLDLCLFVFLVSVSCLLVQWLVILQSFLFLCLVVSECIFFFCQFVILSFEIDNLIFLIFDFDILMFCKAGLRTFDSLFKSGYFFHLQVLFITIFLFELMRFF